MEAGKEQPISGFDNPFKAGAVPLLPAIALEAVWVVVQLKGPYDIALNQQLDGTFGLTADLWQGRVEEEVGQGYGKLLQLYGVHKATIEARKKGLSVLRRHQQNGSIKLVLMGVGI